MNKQASVSSAVWIRLVCVSWAAALVGCAAAPVKAPAAPQPTFAESEALWKSSSARPEYRAYNSAAVESQNRQRLDDRSGCYGAENVVILLLTIDERGVISGVATDPDNPKGRCFQRAYLGRHLPVPPFAPIALRMTMH